MKTTSAASAHVTAEKEESYRQCCNSRIPYHEGCFD